MRRVLPGQDHVGVAVHDAPREFGGLLEALLGVLVGVRLGVRAVVVLDGLLAAVARGATRLTLARPDSLASVRHPHQTIAPPTHIISNL
jgi:hypothetical protein